MRNRLLPVAILLALLLVAVPEKSQGYDQYVFENLNKSRDSLLAQRSELERTRADIVGQVDRLNQKLTRIDQYLRQVDGSVKDLDDALRAH